MGKVKAAWEDYILKTEQDQAIDEINRLTRELKVVNKCNAKISDSYALLYEESEDLKATIRNKDHIIAALKKKVNKKDTKEGIKVPNFKRSK